jgi:hypothetical protein
MAVQSKDLKNGKPVDDEALVAALLAGAPPASASPTKRAFPGGKIAAVLAWLGAVTTTYMMLTGLQPGTPIVIAIPIALVVQFVFTMAERPILSGRPGIFTIAVFVFDALINAGGVFPWLKNIGRTPTAQMIAAAGTPATVEAMPAILISLVVGAIIAVAPEAL